MGKYKYSANDQSLMTPFLYRFFIYPMLKVVPYQIPANFITLLSNSFVTIAFVIATLSFYNNTYYLYFLLPILCFSYLIGDCFDGVQARRTKTGSPLGEYFDHFLDSFVTGLLTGMLLFSLRSKHWIVLILPFQFLYLGQIGAFWERLKNGVISFAKISTSEGVMTIAITCFLTSFQFMQPLIAKEVIFSLSIIDLLLLLGFFFAGLAGIKAIIITKTFSLPLFVHIILSFVVSMLCIYFIKSNTILFLTLITTFYNAFFISPLLSGTSTGKSERWSDILVPLSFILYVYFPSYEAIIYIGQVCYLTLRLLIRFVIFFYNNRQFWVWWNKECEEIDIFASKTH